MTVIWRFVNKKMFYLFHNRKVVAKFNGVEIVPLNKNFLHHSATLQQQFLWHGFDVAALNLPCLLGKLKFIDNSITKFSKYVLKYISKEVNKSKKIIVVNGPQSVHLFSLYFWKLCSPVAVNLWFRLFKNLLHAAISKQKYLVFSRKCMFVTCILYGRVSWLEWLHHRPSISGVSIQCWLLAQHGHTASTLTRGKLCKLGRETRIKNGMLLCNWYNFID